MSKKDSDIDITIKYLRRDFKKNAPKWDKTKKILNRCGKKSKDTQFMVKGNKMVMVDYGDKKRIKSICAFQIVPACGIDLRGKKLFFPWAYKKDSFYYKTIKPYISKINRLGRQYRLPEIRDKNTGIVYKNKKTLINDLNYVWLNFMTTVVGGVGTLRVKIKKDNFEFFIIKRIIKKMN